MSLTFELEAVSPAVFALPHDVDLSADGRQLLVADLGNHRIAVLDALTLDLSGEFANGAVDSPHDVMVDERGLAWVADTGNSRVVALRWTTGGAEEILSLRGPLQRPEGVAATGAGVVYASGAASNNLVKFADGEVVAVAGGFSSPHDVQQDPLGNVWMADSNNDRILRFDPDLNELSVLRDEEFSGPRYLAFDAAGRLWVADKYSHNIKIFDPDGKRLAVLGGRDPGKGAGLFTTPEGVVLRDDTAWIADTGNHRIVRYRVTEQA